MGWGLQTKNTQEACIVTDICIIHLNPNRTEVLPLLLLLCHTENHLLWPRTKLTFSPSLACWMVPEGAGGCQKVMEGAGWCWKVLEGVNLLLYLKSIIGFSKTRKFRNILIHFVNKPKILLQRFCGCFVLQISCEKVI